MGITPSENGIAAGRPAARILEGVLEVVDRVAELDRASVMHGRRGAGIGDEVGELRQGEVDLHDAAARVPAFDVLDEVVGKFVPVSWSRNVIFG